LLSSSRTLDITSLIVRRRSRSDSTRRPLSVRLDALVTPHNRAATVITGARPTVKVHVSLVLSPCPRMRKMFHVGFGSRPFAWKLIFEGCNSYTQPTFRPKAGRINSQSTLPQQLDCLSYMITESANYILICCQPVSLEPTKFITIGHCDLMCSLFRDISHIQEYKASLWI